MDASERRFLLSSTADPAHVVEADEMSGMIYTATFSGEVLLKVRCYGQTRFLQPFVGA